MLNMAQHCSDCCKPTELPRRGLCPSCYEERVRGRDVPHGAACIHCGEPRRACLKRIHVGNQRAVVCHNCEALIARLRPQPSGLDDLLSRLQRAVFAEEWREASEAGVVVHRHFEDFAVGPFDLELAAALSALEESAEL
jgi:hypothetical protein